MSKFAGKILLANIDIFTSISYNSYKLFHKVPKRAGKHADFITMYDRIDDTGGFLYDFHRNYPQH